MPTLVLNPVATSLKAERSRFVDFKLGDDNQAGILITENNNQLAHQLVSGTIDWGDGTPLLDVATRTPVEYTTDGSADLAKIRKTLAVSKLVHPYAPGTYTVVVTARNYRTPTPEIVTQAVTVTVEGAVVVAPKLGTLFGPILPRDNGFPNADQWSLHSGSGVAVIASSVKMLMVTGKGDRIAEPEYGTNIAKILFDPNTPDAESQLQEEITQALNRWEPRASLAKLIIERKGKGVKIVAEFNSNAGQTFQVDASYNRS